MDGVTNRKEMVSKGTRAMDSNEAQEFFPRGAIAFFISLLVGFALIWAGVYMLMFHREFHL